MCRAVGGCLMPSTTFFWSCSFTECSLEQQRLARYILQGGPCRTFPELNCTSWEKKNCNSFLLFLFSWQAIHSNIQQKHSERPGYLQPPPCAAAWRAAARPGEELAVPAPLPCEVRSIRACASRRLSETRCHGDSGAY